MTGHPSPYVGLVPYSEADAELFFGREREQRIIAANLRASRLTLLYGASGVGKSSVLLAGVLPELHRMVATSRNAAVRMRNGRGSTAVAERAPLAVAVMREWRDPPLPRLAEAVHAAVIEACGDDDVAPWVPGTPLLDTLRGYATRVRTLLVILDQFEEYFLYHQEERSPGSFDAEFAAVANDTDLRVNFMLSLREDALSQLDRFKGRIPGLFANYLRVDYLDRPSARIAVTEPIAAYNRALGDAPQSTIADDLIEQVLDDVRTGRLAFGDSQAPAQSNGAPPVDDREDRVETPYLQLVLERLWVAAAQPDGSHRLTLSTLRDLGGAEAIVSRHLTEAMGSLSATDEDLAATVFQFLVTPSKTKIAHRASDLAFWAKRPAADVSRVLDQLAGERRIVRNLPPPPGEDEGRYEIFHDVLAEAVLEWCASHEAERERTALAAKLREEDRARRKARRDRILRRLAVVLGLVIVGLLVLLIPALIERSETQAEERRTRSIGLAAAATGQIPVDPERAVLIAQQALAEDDTSRAREALASAVAASHVVARMGHRRATACGSLCRPGPAAATWSPRPAALTSSYFFGGQWQHISFTPDGRRVAAVVDGKVRIWEPETGDDQTLPRIENASAARIAPDGSSVLVLDTAGVASVASLTSNRVWRVPGTASSVALSPDGQFVASVTFSGEVVVRRVDRPDPLRRLPARGSVQAVEFSPVDPQKILVSAAEHVSLWRWRTSSPPRTLLGKQPRARAALGAAPAVVPAPAGGLPGTAVGVPAAAPGTTTLTMARFSSDGHSIAVVDASGRARVVGVAPVKRYRRTPPSEIGEVIFSPRGNRLLTIERRTATLRMASSGRALSTLAGHAAGITSAAFSPDGRLIATGSSDGTARLWHAESGNQTLELRGHGAAVTDVAFSPDGRRLLTDGEDGTTRLWDVSAGDVLHLRGLNGAPVAAVRSDGKVTVLDPLSGAVRAWTPGAELSRPFAKYGLWPLYGGTVSSDGEHVAMTGERRGRALVVRDLGTGESKALARRPVDLLALSPDGGRLFTLTEYYGRPRGVARVWDTASGERQKLARTVFPPDAYNGVVWGPGDRVLLTSFDGPARVLDATTGRTLQTFWGHLKGASAGTASQRGGFSPDGKLAVTAGARQALVWRIDTGEVTARLQGHTATPTSAAFSPNGRWIVTGDDAGTIRIWDPATERSLAELPGHGAPVASVAFTPSNREILSTAYDGTVRLEQCVPCVSPEELRSLAEDRVTRELTRAERRAYLGESR